MSDLEQQANQLLRHPPGSLDAVFLIRALRAFEALAKEGINVRVIATSEIKISVLVEERYLELGVRCLHEAFRLDQDPAPSDLT